MKPPKKFDRSKFSSKRQESTAAVLEGGEICGQTGESIDDDNNGIATIIPQKNFRDFPKTEEEIMTMRRENFFTIMTLPPL